eukprot:2025198-Karenia_brevis.AAC.1
MGYILRVCQRLSVRVMPLLKMRKYNSPRSICLRGGVLFNDPDACCVWLKCMTPGLLMRSQRWSKRELAVHHHLPSHFPVEYC